MSTRYVAFGRTPDGESIHLEHNALLGINKLIRGKPGSGKTQLLMTVLGQLIAFGLYTIVIIDLGGDPVLFHYLKEQCQRSGTTFRFLSLDGNDASYFFDPFQSGHAIRTNAARLANFVAAGLGLVYAEGYGSGYYSRLNLAVITRAVHSLVSKGAEVSLQCLGEEFRKMARVPSRMKEAAEALFAMEHLLYYPQLTPSDDPEENIDIGRAIERGECIYFYLPTLLEPMTARAIGALVLWSVVVEAVKRKKLGLAPRRTIIGIDEFPQIIGGKNVEDILALCRKYLCELWLSHQTSNQLILRDGDLRPIVTDSTNLRVYFSLPTKDDIDEIVNYSKTATQYRKSTTARGYSSSITMQENELPTFDANTCKEISATFGHAVMIRDLGDGHRNPIHLVCEPPLDKAEYDRLSVLPLPQRLTPLLTPGPKELLVGDDLVSPAEVARRVALRELLKAKREALNGWRRQMKDEA